MPGKAPMSAHCLVLASVAVLLRLASAGLFFPDCETLGDFGGHEKEGNIQVGCIQDHNFVDEAHVWRLRKSVIRRTNFTNCTFADSDADAQDFSDSYWSQVLFKDSRFSSRTPSNSKKSITTKFNRMAFEDVVFDNCTFDSTVSMLFENFAFRGVTFRDCKFYGPLKFSKGLISTLAIRRGLFGARVDANDVQSPRYGGDVTFSELNGFDLSIHHARGDHTFRLQGVNIAHIELAHTRLGNLYCHEKLAGADAVPQLKSTLNDTILRNVSISDSLQCNEARMRSFVLASVRVRNLLDLSKSTISYLSLTQLGELDAATCATFKMEDGVVDGRRMLHVNATKGSLQRTVFQPGIEMPADFIKNTPLELKDTVFSQLRVGGQCCSEACPPRGCLCNFSGMERTDGPCPAVPSETRSDEKDDSCFPGSAVVSVRGGDGQLRQARIDSLRIGDEVASSAHGGTSEVVFFGHRAPGRFGWFIEVCTAAAGRCEATPRRRGDGPCVTLSGGHLLPVRGRGEVAARSVRVGDEVLLERGAWVAVKRTRWTVAKGLFAPATRDGTIVVDGVVASCFTEVTGPWAGQAALAPVRGAVRLGWAGRMLASRIVFLHDWSAAELVQVVVRGWEVMAKMAFTTGFARGL